MSLSQDTMLSLMMYADGELEIAEVAKIEALLVSNGEARQFVAELAGLSGAVVDAVDLRVAPIAIDVTATVMAAIEATDGERGAASMSSKPSNAVGGVAAPATSRTNNVRSLDAARGRRRAVFGAVTAALALAAGAIFVIKSSPSALPNAQPVAAMHADKPGENGSGSAQGSSALPPEALAMVSDVDVNSVESTSGVSVFYLAGSAASMSSVVVWIDDKVAGQ